MICEKYSSRVCIILVLEKTKCLVRQIKTGMPRLTITNHSELYPEVLNSLNKMLLMKCQSQLHNKIRKHAMKQASRNRSVFPRSSANFLSRGLLSCPRHKSAFKKVMSKLNEQLQIVSHIASAIINFEIPKRWHCTTGFLPYCSKLTTKHSFREKRKTFCKQASNVLSGTRNFKTFDRHMSIMFD